MIRCYLTVIDRREVKCSAAASVTQCESQEYSKQSAARLISAGGHREHRHTQRCVICGKQHRTPSDSTDKNSGRPQSSQASDSPGKCSGDNMATEPITKPSQSNQQSTTLASSHPQMEHVEMCLNITQPEMIPPPSQESEDTTSSSNNTYNKSILNYINPPTTKIIRKQLRIELSRLQFLTADCDGKIPVTEAVIKLRNHRGSIVPMSMSTLSGTSRRQRLTLELCDRATAAPSGDLQDLQQSDQQQSYQPVIPISDIVLSENKSLLRHVCNELSNRVTTIEKAIPSLQVEREPHLQVCHVA